MELSGWKSFPHPNPFYPSPPRGGVGKRWAIAFATLLVATPMAMFISIPVLYLTGNSPSPLVFNVLFWGGIIVGLMDAYFLPRLARKVAWNEGRIVPAIIDPTARFDWAAAAYVGLGCLAMLAPISITGSNYVRVPVLFIDRGRPRLARIAVHKNTEIVNKQGVVVWILLPHGVSPAAFVTKFGVLNEVAREVPPEVLDWFAHAEYRAFQRAERSRRIRSRARRIERLGKEKGRGRAFSRAYSKVSKS